MRSWTFRSIVVYPQPGERVSNWLHPCEELTVGTGGRYRGEETAGATELFLSHAMAAKSVNKIQFIISTM